LTDWVVAFLDVAPWTGEARISNGVFPADRYSNYVIYVEFFGWKLPAAIITGKRWF
jgi:hypothetical protein